MKYIKTFLLWIFWRWYAWPIGWLAKQFWRVLSVLLGRKWIWGRKTKCQKLVEKARKLKNKFRSKTSTAWIDCYKSSGLLFCKASDSDFSYEELTKALKPFLVAGSKQEDPHIRDTIRRWEREQWCLLRIPRECERDAMKAVQKLRDKGLIVCLEHDGSYTRDSKMHLTTEQYPFINMYPW